MKPGSILIAVVLTITILSLVCVWFYPSVQDLAAANDTWNGIRGVTGKLQAEVVASLDVLPQTPENATLIAIPNTDYAEEDMLRLQQFVDGGGRLVLMDDYGYGNRILTYLGTGITFSGQSLLDPLFCYQNQRMPRATDFSPGVQKEGISVITLDRATTLDGVEESQVIAWSSATSFLDANGDGAWQEGELKGPLAVAAEFRVGKGRVLAVASPGMIINSLYQRDDNLPFLRYLTACEAGADEILVDGSHLSTSPLDVSKIRLVEIRQALSKPYAVLGILLLVFLVVSAYTLRKGDVLGSSQ